jgi:type VI secretion system protein ImpG
MAGEFAREFPKIAGRLALDQDGHEICPDPFVERLLEGFAYLTARVQVKLDAEFPRLTQALLESAYPHYLAPVPSMLMAHFEPELDEAGLADGYPIPRGTSLRSNLGRTTGTPCEFRTSHAVTLWPLKLLEAQYITRDIASLGLPNSVKAQAAFVLKFQVVAGVPAKALKMNALDIYIRGSGELPYKVHEAIFSNATSLVLQAGAGRTRVSDVLPASCIQQVGFGKDEALLPPSPRSFEGYRILREYFAFPERFLFMRLAGLLPSLRRFEGNQFDVVIALDAPNVQLENRVDATAFELFCTPAINLFQKRMDRIPLSDRFPEYHVIPDKTRQLDFEVFELTRVAGIGANSTDEQPFTPFYFNYDRDRSSSAYYTINRVPRVLSSREKQFGEVSRYVGSEAYISIVDGNCAPYNPDLYQLAITGLCTNRHLPIQMPVGVGRTDFYLDSGGPVQAVRCLNGPTEPVPSAAEGEMSWRIISHLSLNYLSLTDSSPTERAAALRELLSLYAEHPKNPQANASMRKQVRGVLSVQSKPILRRALTPGPIAFARGLEVEVLVQESEFSGGSAFLLGMVLEQFFAKYVSINSFTETVLKSVERGEVKRWPAQPGRRDVL